MKCFLLLLLSVVSSSATPCGTSEICTDFAYEKDDLAICSAQDMAQIWNTTTGDCHVHIDADLRTVSYMSMIFTLGVTPAVRYPIGDECWQYVPQDIAMAIVESGQHFDTASVCHAHPLTSPSLGWEMRYVAETRGYDDCASLVVLHEDYLVSCVRLHADARALATFAYMLICVIGMFIVCCLPCVCMCDCW